MKLPRAAALLLAAVSFGCDTDDKAALKQRRYELEVLLVNRENVLLDLKSAKAELGKLQRVVTGVETDYSVGGLVAAMDARVDVKVEPLPVAKTGYFLELRAVRVSAPHSLAPELERLFASSFPSVTIIGSPGTRRR